MKMLNSVTLVRPSLSDCSLNDGRVKYIVSEEGGLRLREQVGETMTERMRKRERE